jgi:hypothetical protein
MEFDIKLKIVSGLVVNLRGKYTPERRHEVPPCASEVEITNISLDACDLRAMSDNDDLAVLIENAIMEQDKGGGYDD